MFKLIIEYSILIALLIGVYIEAGICTVIVLGLIMYVIKDNQ